MRRYTALRSSLASAGVPTRSLITRSLAVPANLFVGGKSIAKTNENSNNQEHRLLFRWTSTKNKSVALTFMSTSLQSASMESGTEGASENQNAPLVWDAPGVADDASEIQVASFGELSQTFAAGRTNAFEVNYRTMHLTDYQVAQLLCVLDGKLDNVTLHEPFFLLKLSRPPAVVPAAAAAGHQKKKPLQLNLVGDLYLRRTTPNEGDSQQDTTSTLSGMTAQATPISAASFGVLLDDVWCNLLKSHLESCLVEMFGIENAYLRKRASMRERSIAKQAGRQHTSPPHVGRGAPRPSAGYGERSPRGPSFATEHRQRTPQSAPHNHVTPQARSALCDLGYYNASRRHPQKGVGVYASQLQQQEINQALSTTPTDNNSNNSPRTQRGGRNQHRDQDEQQQFYAAPSHPPPPRSAKSPANEAHLDHMMASLTTNVARRNKVPRYNASAAAVEEGEMDDDLRKVVNSAQQQLDEVQSSFHSTNEEGGELTETVSDDYDPQSVEPDVVVPVTPKRGRGRPPLRQQQQQLLEQQTEEFDIISEDQQETEVPIVKQGRGRGRPPSSRKSKEEVLLEDIEFAQQQYEKENQIARAGSKKKRRNQDDDDVATDVLLAQEEALDVPFEEGEDVVVAPSKKQKKTAAKSAVVKRGRKVML